MHTRRGEVNSADRTLRSASVNIAGPGASVIARRAVETTVNSELRTVGHWRYRGSDADADAAADHRRSGEGEPFKSAWQVSVVLRVFDHLLSFSQSINFLKTLKCLLMVCGAYSAIDENVWYDTNKRSRSMYYRTKQEAQLLLW